MKHIEFEEIVGHLDGTLVGQENRIVSEHLEDCESCAHSAGRLRKFFLYGRIAQEETVPQATTARLLNIFQPIRKPKTAGGSFRTILASLVFDEWQTAFNERSAVGGSRQLLYRAERFNIDIRLNFEDEHCQVSGQVFPDCVNATAELTSMSGAVSTEFNRDSEFVLPRVLSGVYDLKLELDGELVEIPGISLRK